MGGKTVFVLGAGFSKAFAPNAPLMEDDYDLSRCDCYQLPAMRKIIDAESRRAACNKKAAGRLNIERLLTRAATVMPYDDPFTAAHQLAILRSDIQRCHIKRIYGSQAGGANSNQLKGLAKHILDKEIDCISFNYDPLLDAALYKTNHPDEAGKPSPEGSPRWYPESGYGFYCPSTEALLFGRGKDVPESAMVLLKLNGSLTWLPRLREPWPYRLGSVAHNDWRLRNLSEIGIPLSRRDFLNKHFEMDPYIAPPTMSRSTLVDQPILSLVWRQAYDRLWLAQDVVFVGYSFPASDYVAKWLFQEGLAEGVCARVVNYAQCESAKQRIRASYREVFRGLGDVQFRFDGAVAWVEDLLRSG